MSAMLNPSNNNNYCFLTDFDQTCINVYSLFSSLCNTFYIRIAFPFNIPLDINVILWYQYYFEPYTILQFMFFLSFVIIYRVPGLLQIYTRVTDEAEWSKVASLTPSRKHTYIILTPLNPTFI